jgi:hypothetical protein
MTVATDLRGEFDGETVPLNSLAFCQIINPPNLPLAQLKKLGDSCHWGLFVPNDQAQKVNFTPDDSFTPVQVTFGDEGNERVVEGWLAKRVRLAVIHRSNGIDVQEKSGNGWRTLGAAYRGGIITELGLKAEADKETYRFRTRYLILLLDKDNQPLHDVPLSLGLGRGPGGSIGEELRTFRSEVDLAYREYGGVSGVQLSDSAISRTAIEIELGLHKGKAPFVCPKRRSKPTVDSSGIEEEVTRHERTVTLVSEPIGSWLIAKESETGKLIRSLFEQYQGFGTSAVGEETAPPATESAYEPSLPEDGESEPTFDRAAIALAPYTDDIDF